MQEKTMLDMLSQDGVSIKRQQTVEQSGKAYVVGEPWRRAYVNSISGRQELDNEVDEPYKSVILLMWGDSPTVSDVTG